MENKSMDGVLNSKIFQGKPLKTIVFASVLATTLGQSVNALSSPSIDEFTDPSQIVLLQKSEPIFSKQELQEIADESFKIKNEHFNKENFDAENFKPPLLKGEQMDEMVSGLFKDGERSTGFYTREDGATVLLSSAETGDLSQLDRLKHEAKTLGIDPLVLEVYDEIRLSVGVSGNKNFPSNYMNPVNMLRGDAHEIDENIFEQAQDIRYVNIDKDEIESAKSFFPDSVDIKDIAKFCIYHELAHSHETKYVEKAIFPFFDTELREEKVLEGEMYADAYSIMQMARDFKAEHGSEEGLKKFQDFKEGVIAFRGSMVNSEELTISQHGTLPAIMPIFSAIESNWDKIDDVPIKNMKKVSDYISNNNYVIDHSNIIQNTLPDDSNVLKTLQDYRDTGENYKQKALEQKIVAKAVLQKEIPNSEVKDFKGKKIVSSFVSYSDEDLKSITESLESSSDKLENMMNKTKTFRHQHR